MLKNIIKPGWQSENPDARLKAVAKLDPKDDADRSVLSELAISDPEPSVQRAAMLQLADPVALRKIVSHDQSEETLAMADAVLSQLLGDDSKYDLTATRKLLEQNPAMADTVLRFSCHADLRSELLNSYSLEQRTELIATIAYTDTRQQIAECLESQEQLERARLLLKGKDKSAEKIIRGKLDDLHEQEKIENQHTADALNICEKMEFVVGHQDEPDFSAKVSVWQQRWDSLGFEPATELAERFNLAATAAHAAVEEMLAAKEAQEQQQNLGKDLNEYCSELANKSWAELDALKNAMLDKHNHAVDAWNKLTKLSHPEPTLATEIATTKAGLASLAKFIAQEACDDETASRKPLKQALEQLTWPDHLPELVVAKEARSKLGELDAEQQASKKAESKKLDQLHQRINRLLGTSKKGDLAKAKGELAAVSKAAEHFIGKNKAGLDERLGQATELVSKMADWKDFATAPKYIGLCEAMESLQNSKQHPDKLSAEISKLQNTWKDLGHTNSADEHWERFKLAADAAYKPCAEFFTKRHAKRKKNLELREPLVIQMRELLEQTDWEAQPDYKKIEQRLQDIHREWQKIKDVERGPGQKQWNRISKLRANVYAKLDVVYDANIALKQGLIDQAKTMLDGDLKNDPIAKLKHLQCKWKDIGVTRRKQDQAAWKAFKQVTDDVYSQIQAQRKEQRAEEDSKVAAHRDLIKQLQQLSRNADSLAEADHKYEQLIAEYQALPPHPKDVHEKLIERINSDFQRAENSFSKTRDRLLKEQKQGAFALLKQKAELCTQLEKGAAKSDAKKIEKLEEQLNAIEISNKDHRVRMEQRIKLAAEQDKAEAGDLRRMMCIDLEILLGKDSPPEDSALRMKTQLERMKSKGLGQGQIEVSKKLNQMKIDWLCQPGAEPNLQSQLDQRFWRLIEGS